MSHHKSTYSYHPRKLRNLNAYPNKQEGVNLTAYTDRLGKPAFLF